MHTIQCLESTKAKFKNEEGDIRKNAEERFRLVVEAAPNGRVKVYPRGMITLVNNQAKKRSLLQETKVLISKKEPFMGGPRP